jgi:hypothetical protein
MFVGCTTSLLGRSGTYDHRGGLLLCQEGADELALRGREVGEANDPRIHW